MGEIAEDIIDGVFDSVTGEYIGEGVGYPRTLTKESFSLKEQIKGVKIYLFKNGIKDRNEQNEIILRFGVGEKTTTLDNTCLAIQKDFGKFTKWFHHSIKKKQVNGINNNK